MGRRTATIAVVLAVLVGLAIAARVGLSPSSANGRLAPSLPREALVGRQVSLPGLLTADGGRPALVVFWASWCDPCEREAPALERFSQSAGGRGRIVGVDWSDGLSGARQFVRRYGWTFPNERDGEGTVGNAYRLTGLPTTFVIDGAGRIRQTLHGPQSERSLRRALAGVESS